MHALRITSLALASTSLALPCFAGVLHVGPAGSGAQFQQIQHAINAAQPGDTILVQAGSYSRIALTKPLRLIGAGSGQVVVGAWPAALPVLEFSLTESSFTNSISDLPALTETFISGFEFRGSGYMQVVSGQVSPVEQGQLTITSCAGTVVLDDILCRPSSGSVALFTIGLEAFDCADLRVQRSALEGEQAFFGPSWVWQKCAEGLDAMDCTLAISTSTVRGGSSALPGVAPASGLRLISSNPNSRFALDDVQVFGGGQAGATPQGAAAVFVSSSQPVLVHGASTLLRGGDAPFSVGGVGMIVSGSTLELDPAAQLSGGIGAGGAAADLLLQPGSTSITLPVAAATLSAPSAAIPGGGSAILDLHAEPHSAFVLFASGVAAPGLTLSGFSAPLWIFPHTSVLLAGVVLGPSGQHSFAFPTPTGLPAPIVVHLQGISASGAGLMLSNPQTLSVL
ncbi:MAG: hypothetical protein EPO68_07830 [Planctomycetota bacterium]|nr:MAG: hypothetical protein EPO68_07830 [Planctomycetota bacterium]